ncbi:hypothetical protein ES707_11706 [subsurface metagenome]
MFTRCSTLNVAVTLLIGLNTLSCAFADFTYTYGGSFNLPLPDPNGSGETAVAEATINVGDHITIADLDVGINITHPHVFDLQLFLQSPQGTQICLNAYDFNPFFVGGNYTGTIFDDEAPQPIEHGKPPFTGQFKPHSPDLLSHFDGQDAFGDWLLQIHDVWPFHAGQLDAFELIITVPEPSSFILLSAGLFCLRRKSRRRR